MLEVTMDFPTCWNGELDSDDHRSHVVYADEDDLCPETHQSNIPLVSISVYIKNYDGGWHTFSDDSGVFHADYLSGWDTDELRNIIDECALDVEEECHAPMTFKGGEPTGDFSHDEKHNVRVQFQPPPLDTSAITTETINNTAALPRGTCNGTLLGGDSTTGEDPQTTQPPPTTTTTQSTTTSSNHATSANDDQYHIDYNDNARWLLGRRQYCRGPN